MNNLSFQKFKTEINERRYIGPEGTKEFKKLSPKLKSAIRDVYSMIDKTPDPLLGKIEGIINQVAKKQGVKVSDIEDYFDNETIK
jgi:hypothetical protein|tara:strand:- start:154 stop:408 length:255 start_codon:yes stop_codon:yes gene_type:complete